MNDIECGRVAFQEKKFDTAIEFFQKALSSSSHVEKARIHANLSACYLKTNKFKSALEHADASFEVSKKTFPKALFRRAEALEKMREYPRARGVGSNVKDGRDVRGRGASEIARAGGERERVREKVGKERTREGEEEGERENGRAATGDDAEMGDFKDDGAERNG